VTGELLTALEALRPHLGPKAHEPELLRAVRRAMLAWVNANEVAERRRVRLEARLAERIVQFEEKLEQNLQRNARIRFMHFQLEELRRAHNELRERLSLEPVVFEQALGRELSIEAFRQERALRRAERRVESLA